MPGDTAPTVLCLTGPTASGKTDLAVALAGTLDCELISVDSALVYRGLDIGSAKPAYPHHLVDIRDPSQPYSAAEFAADASQLVAEILARGRTPLLVGGTPLYFRAFLEGLAAMPGADPARRAAIEARAATRGWPALHAELAAVDPAAAARIHPNHSQRIARALEVFEASGVPLSEWHRRQDPASPAARYSVRQLAICPRQRSVLHERIARRFAGMLDAGLVAEVRALRERGDLHPGLPAIRAVGYRQIWAHLAGECTLEEASQRAIAATRQLAKRQLTWLRKWQGLHWLETDAAGNVLPPAGSEGARDAVLQTPLAASLNYLQHAPMT